MIAPNSLWQEFAIPVAAKLSSASAALPERTIEQQFDQWAPTYESGRLAGWYQAQTEILLDHLDLDGYPRILDIGCGTGWTLRRLSKRAPHIVGVGIDVSSGMVQQAQTLSTSEGLTNLTFKKMDWESDLDDLSGPFDAILCISAFHYFAQPLRALIRMRSIISDGGQLLIVERALDGSILTRAWNFAHRHLVKDHVTFAASDHLSEMARQAGFGNVRILDRVNRMFWKNKLNTSLLLLEARPEGNIQ